MRILPLGNIDIGHQPFRSRAPLVLDGSGSHNRVVIHIVFIDSADPEIQHLHIRIFDADGVPFLNPHGLCHAYGKKHLVFPRQRQIFAVSPEILEVFNTILRCNHVNFPGLILCGDLNAALMVEQSAVGQVLDFLAELLILLLRRLLLKIYLQIIGAHIPELVIHHIDNGIPEAEARHQQCRTAADSHQHHGKALAVTEDIPDGDLVEKADMLPNRQPLQQNLLAQLRCLGTDELCRFLTQSSAAAIPGHKQHDTGVDRNHSNAQRPVDGENHMGLDVQHDFINRPQQNGEKGAADHQSQSAAQHSTAAGIDHVFADDGSIAVAQCLQGSDLGALLFNHPGHGGDTHQRGHQQEEHREYPGDTGHNIRAAVQRIVAYVGVSVHDEGLGALQIIDLLTGIRQLNFGIRQLLLGIGDLLLPFCLAVFVFHPTVVNLLLGVVQLFVVVIDLGDLFLDFLLTGENLFFGGFQLSLIGIKLSNSGQPIGDGCNLCFAGQKRS